MDQAEEFYIGLMSGTSVDGIDAALVAFQSSEQLRVIDTLFTPFDSAIRAKITDTALNNKKLFQNQDSALHVILADHYANASLDLIKKAKVDPGAIKAIANHGQTVRHEPNASPAFSLQLGDGQIIANKTGIQTISQFRQADLSHGGQGAPLMPAFHKAIFNNNSTNTLILNLGGIANLTYLNGDVTGFDTGPANCLLDQWIHSHRSQHFDSNGDWAKSGSIILPVLTKLLEDPYFNRTHPKSTGTDYFNLSWLHASVPNLSDFKPEDIQATLLALTLESVKLGLRQLNATTGELFVCGGGAQNKHMIASLKNTLASFTIKPTDSLGVPSDWVEAVGFAWLGYCFVHAIPSNLPSVTGANKQVCLGVLHNPVI